MENVAGDFYRITVPGVKPPSGRQARPVDEAIVNALVRFRLATTVDGLGFGPPPEDEVFLRRLRMKSSELSAAMQQIVESDGRGASVADQAVLRHRAEQLAIDLNQVAAELANTTTAETDALIAQNASTYASSRNLFIGVAVGAILLALCSASSSPGL